MSVIYPFIVPPEMAEVYREEKYYVKDLFDNYNNGPSLVFIDKEAN